METNSISDLREARRVATANSLLTLADADRFDRYIRPAVDRQQPTPEAVAVFANLLLRDDFGNRLLPAPHHRLWLELMCDERIKRLLIIAPPESAKTTWSVLAYIGLYVSIFPERSVIIGSVTGDVAQKRSLSLRNLIETPEYRRLFPRVQKARGMPFEPGQWSIAPDGAPTPGRVHPTVAAYGTGGSVIGSRADIALADDLLDYDNSRTAHQRQLVTNWFYTSFYSRLKAKTGRIIVIGTAWTHDDIYQHLREEGNFVVCHTPLQSPSEQVRAYLTYPDDWTGAMLGRPMSERVKDVLKPTVAG